MKLRILIMLVGTIGLFALPASAATYDLFFFTYCSPGTNCGYADDAAYRAELKGAVQEINLQWEPTGISFRPVVIPIIEDNFYSMALGCDDPVPEGPDEAAIRQQWHDQVAALYPTAITVMLTPNASWCCADPPNLPYGGGPEDSNLMGIKCSTGFGEYRLGAIMAHEMGHFFCLKHSFSFEDVATHPVPDWDPDTYYQVNDTPEDASRFEPWKPDSSGDENASGNPNVGHQ